MKIDLTNVDLIGDGDKELLGMGLQPVRASGDRASLWPLKQVIRAYQDQYKEEYGQDPTLGQIAKDLDQELIVVLRALGLQ